MVTPSFWHAAQKWWRKADEACSAGACAPRPPRSWPQQVALGCLRLRETVAGAVSQSSSSSSSTPAPKPSEGDASSSDVVAWGECPDSRCQSPPPTHSSSHAADTVSPPSIRQRRCETLPAAEESPVKGGDMGTPFASHFLHHLCILRALKGEQCVCLGVWRQHSGYLALPQCV